MENVTGLKYITEDMDEYETKFMVLVAIFLAALQGKIAANLVLR